MKVEECIELLYDKDANLAYQSLKKLEEISEQEESVYPYIEEFIKMINQNHSYITIRGFRLICKNAKWDRNNKINKSIDEILLVFEHEKGFVIRQCLEAVKDLIADKKELKEKIKEKLLEINCLKYPESVRHLILKDINNILSFINQISYYALDDR